jgi:hypothetical protein
MFTIKTFFCLFETPQVAKKTESLSRLMNPPVVTQTFPLRQDAFGRRKASVLLESSEEDTATSLTLLMPRFRLTKGIPAKKPA